MTDPQPAAIETKPPQRELRTIEVTELCFHCGNPRPRRAVHVIELHVMVRDVEVPDSAWVCVDSQACMMSRTFPDLL